MLGRQQSRAFSGAFAFGAGDWTEVRGGWGFPTFQEVAYYRNPVVSFTGEPIIES